jgi:hypothetical protein
MAMYLADDVRAEGVTESDPAMTDNAAAQQHLEPLPNPADLSKANALARKANGDLTEMFELFTGWHAWHSSDGHLYANPIKPPTDRMVIAGCSRTLTADSPAEMVELIRLDAAVVQRLAAEDAAKI